jgi:hypothetical protein
MTHFVESKDLDAVVTMKPNVLIYGSRGSTDAFLSSLSAHYSAPLRELPVASLCGHADISARTAVVRDIANFSRSDQEMLLGWLDRSERSTQLIATTDRPLLHLVDTGRFDARLFYRLNTVYLDLNA